MGGCLFDVRCTLGLLRPLAFFCVSACDGFCKYVYSCSQWVGQWVDGAVSNNQCCARLIRCKFRAGSVGLATYVSLLGRGLTNGC